MINGDILNKLKIVAQQSNHRQFKIAASIIYKNSIISIAHNVMKTHTFQKKYGKNQDAIYFHAETHAIYKALQQGFDQFHKSTLAIVRVKWDSTDRNSIIYGLANPCDGCIRCIYDFKIKKVIYTLDEIVGCKSHFGIIEL